MQDVSFDWNVELPERGSASLGGRRPLATLVVTSSTHGQERISVPKAVGRRLASLADSDGEQPESRAELLYRVRSMSLELARSKAEDLLNRRDYSSSELAAKLREAGYHPSVADEVVARFVEVGLLDDRRFAELFARSKAAAGWGRIKIERELARRGVDATQLEGWPSGYLEEDESETAFALASRRRLSGKNDFQKLVRFLCGRGFPMGVAMDAAKRVLAEAEEG
mgnify:FL=1